MGTKMLIESNDVHIYVDVRAFVDDRNIRPDRGFIDNDSQAIPHDGWNLRSDLACCMYLHPNLGVPIQYMHKLVGTACSGLENANAIATTNDRRELQQIIWC
jgi:hypothetical protein